MGLRDDRMVGLELLKVGLIVFRFEGAAVGRLFGWELFLVVGLTVFHFEGTNVGRRDEPMIG